MSKYVAAVLLCALCLNAQSGSTSIAASISWKPLEFLIGTWEAKTQGGSVGASSSGTYTFKMDLRDTVLARYSGTAGCKGPADFNCDHVDLLYAYSDATARSYKAIYFDNEGHVIHYAISISSAGSAVFLSDPSQLGPQHRLSYELKGSVMYGKFQMRMPGQTEFKSYLEWSGEKKN